MTGNHEPQLANFSSQTEREGESRGVVSRGGQGPETTFRHTMPTASLLERLNNIPTDQTDEGADSAAADSASTWLFDRTPQAQGPGPGNVVESTAEANDLVAGPWAALSIAPLGAAACESSSAATPGARDLVGATSPAPKRKRTLSEGAEGPEGPRSPGQRARRSAQSSTATTDRYHKRVAHEHAPGRLSAELRAALGMASTTTVPPYLARMQDAGLPPPGARLAPHP